MTTKRAYGVFVQTPPPSETHMIAMAETMLDAIKVAAKWGDNQIHWTTQSEGVSSFGEKVFIEEIKLPGQRGKPLHFPKWDEIFETGVFEEYMAPELGFHLTKYGEVVGEEREEWEKVWKEVFAWLRNALHVLSIEPYSLQGQAIYPATLNILIDTLKYQIPEGPREWTPARRNWKPALVKAFKKLLKANQ